MYDAIYQIGRKLFPSDCSTLCTFMYKPDNVISFLQCMMQSISLVENCSDLTAAHCIHTYINRTMWYHFYSVWCNQIGRKLFRSDCSTLYTYMYKPDNVISFPQCMMQSIRLVENCSDLTASHCIHTCINQTMWYHFYSAWCNLSDWSKTVPIWLHHTVSMYSVYFIYRKCFLCLLYGLGISVYQFL